MPSVAKVQISLPVDGVEREHGAVFADDVHHVVDDERAEGEAPGRARRRMEPLQLELMDVALVDLLERGILRALDAAARLAPGRVQPRARLAAHDEQLRSGDDRQSRCRHAQSATSSFRMTHVLQSFAVSTQRRGAQDISAGSVSHLGGSARRLCATARRKR